jgi:hypothetical protein
MGRGKQLLPSFFVLIIFSEVRSKYDVSLNRNQTDQLKKLAIDYATCMKAKKKSPAE